MPSSPGKPPDELAKDLYPYLANQCRHAELVRLGWFEFVNDHCPSDPDCDAIVVAFEAFSYLFVDDQGVWNRHTSGLSAVLAFLRGQTGRTPTLEQADALKVLLTAPTVDESALEEWFYAVYD